MTNSPPSIQRPLEPRERFDREYLLAVVDKDLFWLEKAKFPFSNPKWYIDAIDPDVYLNRNYAPLDVRMKAYIKYAHGIPKMVNDIKANLQSPLPKTYVELGISVRRTWRVLFEECHADFRVGDRSRSAKAAADADAAAAQAMDALKAHIDRGTQEGQRQVCVRPGAVRADDQADRAGGLAGRPDRGGGPRRPRAQHRRAQERMRHLRAEGVAAAMRREDVRQQAERRAVEAARAQLAHAQGLHRQEQRGLDSRAADEAWSQKRRPTIGPMPHSSKSPAPTIMGWRPSTTSRRRIRSGARPSRQAYIPERSDAAVHDRARGVAGTFPAVPAFECQSFEARGACGWDMPSPKAGRIIAKK